jgi:hypothetical protein
MLHITPTDEPTPPTLQHIKERTLEALKARGKQSIMREIVSMANDLADDDDPHLDRTMIRRGLQSLEREVRRLARQLGLSLHSIDASIEDRKTGKLYRWPPERYSGPPLVALDAADEQE